MKKFKLITTKLLNEFICYEFDLQIVILNAFLSDVIFNCILKSEEKGLDIFLTLDKSCSSSNIIYM